MVDPEAGKDPVEFSKAVFETVGVSEPGVLIVVDRVEADKSGVC